MMQEIHEYVYRFTKSKQHWHHYIFLHISPITLHNINTQRRKDFRHEKHIKLNLTSMITLTVKHCIFSGQLVSSAAPWFDSTASEM